MPGTIIFKPLSAKLTRNTEFFGKMDPYCRVIIGKQKLESQVCRNGGKHPHWEDTLVFKRNSEPICHVELKEKDWLLPDDLIGCCEVNLNEVESQKRVLKWYPMAFKGKPVGQVLLEISYESDMKGQQPNKTDTTVHRVVEETIVPVPQGQNIQNIPASNPLEMYSQPPNQEWHTTNQQFNHPQFQPQPQYNMGQGADKYPVLGQDYQGTIWAPSYVEGQQESNNYPQIYPQFSQNIYSNSNPQGGYHQNK